MMNKINKEEAMYYLKQNGFKTIDNDRDDVVKVKAYNAIYNVYLDVTCHKCGAPLMAIDEEDEFDVCCTNRFCKDF